MPRDTTSDQPFFHHCAYCGVPLSGRFSPCPACHALPIDSLDMADNRGERTARSRVLAAPRAQLESLPASAGLPEDRASRRSAQTKLSPYELIDEATFVPGGRRRKRPMALAAAALATLGVVYAGFILLNDDDASVDTPVTVFGTVHSDNTAQNTAQNAARNAARSVAAAPKAAAPRPAAVVAQPPRPVVVARQQPEPVHAAPVAPPPPPVVATSHTVAPPPVIATAHTIAPPPAIATARTLATPPVIPTSPTVAPPPVIATAHTAAPQPIIATAHTAPPQPVNATAHAVAPTTPPSAAISAPTPRGTAVVSTNSNINTDTTTAPLTQADKLRADAERNLKAAHGYLQRGNLSATKARLAAVITAQPDNRDARRMRAEVSTLEQQRDALLSLARGCGNVRHWDCASHNANEALQIDSSSKAARRLVALASHESAWQTMEASKEMPGDARQTMEPSKEMAGDIRALLAHH
ncbi:hypothetical protein [Paraburkholderia sp. HP33-1]|uniref:hypothetical protein n=1 Tax=Paraburkholderia sp. HP33-1 TaxID=2883243 RepID=UPI001F226B3C|nr:hypothetical protein [Paraburkholderia sp. HP33-1]